MSVKNLARYSAERDIPLDDKAFRYWNVKTDRWETEGGMVGQETVDGIVMEAKGFWIIGLLRALIGFGQNAVSNRKFRAALDAERGGPAV